MDATSDMIVNFTSSTPLFPMNNTERLRFFSYKFPYCAILHCNDNTNVPCKDKTNAIFQCVHDLKVNVMFMLLLFQVKKRRIEWL